MSTDPFPTSIVTYTVGDNEISSTTTSLSTSISRAPLITPFVQPPSCSNLFTTITTTFVYSDDGDTTSTLSLILSNTADPAFSACQAPGWDRGAAFSDQFSFSPAVCPSGWTAYDLLADYAGSTSSAHCCNEGYTYGSPSIYGLSITQAREYRVGSVCYRHPGGSKVSVATTRSPFRGVDYYPSGIQMHQPYHVAWHQSDISTLSPAPPATVCSNDMIPTWVPGKKAEKCDDYKSSSGYKGLEGVVWFLMVGLPILVLLIFGGCVWCCCSHRRHKRQDREEARIKLENRAVRAI